MRSRRGAVQRIENPYYAKRDKSLWVSRVRVIDRREERVLTNIWVTQSGTEEATKLRIKVLLAIALQRTSFNF